MCLAYAPDGAQLASGSGDKTVRLWDPRGEKPPQRLGRAYQCMSYAWPMRRMARSWPREVRIRPCGCGIRAGRNPRNAWTGIRMMSGAWPMRRMARSWPRAVGIIPCGCGIRAGRNPRQRLDGHTDWVTCLAYAPDGAQLASGSRDKTVRLWDPRGEKPSNVLDGHTDDVMCLAYAPDGAQLASGGAG